MKNAVIVVAGGKGKRMNSNIAKQYLLLDGKEILFYTLKKFEDCDLVDEIILVTGKDEIEFCRKEIVNKYGLKKVTNIINGGKERQDSVYNGIKALGEDTEIVLIHDGVRPFVRIEDIKKIIKETEKHGSCVLGVKVKDTVKLCDMQGVVLDTPKRESLWLAQTPQSFKYTTVKEAYEKAYKDGFWGTDDSMLVERMGEKIKMVEGSYNNIKITTPEDLYMGEAILKELNNN